MTRTFIALELNPELQKHLAGVIRQVQQLLPHAHYVDPAGIHLTLAFLGELGDERLEAAIQATEATAHRASAFAYRLARLGLFGPPQQPRTAWIGIDEPSGALQFLYRTLNRELERSGFSTEKRPFSPHFTIARFKAPLAPDELQCLQNLLQGKQQGIVSSTTYQAQSLDVMKSELLPAGPLYTRLRICSLQK